MVVIGCLRKVGKAVSVFNQLEATRQNLTQHILHTKNSIKENPNEGIGFLNDVRLLKERQERRLVCTLYNHRAAISWTSEFCMTHILQIIVQGEKNGNTQKNQRV